MAGAAAKRKGKTVVTALVRGHTQLFSLAPWVNVPEAESENVAACPYWWVEHAPAPPAAQEESPPFAMLARGVVEVRAPLQSFKIMDAALRTAINKAREQKTEDLTLNIPCFRNEQDLDPGVLLFAQRT